MKRNFGRVKKVLGNLNIAKDNGENNMCIYECVCVCIPIEWNSPFINYWQKYYGSNNVGHFYRWQEFENFIKSILWIATPL